jgi:peptide deformylase
MQLPLLYYGHKLLRTKCEPVAEITDEIRQLAWNMVETMDIMDGVGLAAPQVGRLIRLFVLRNYIETSDGHLTLSEPRFYINPKLSQPSKETSIEAEGCLSVPGLRGRVERPLKIVVEATDLHGQSFIEEVEGHNARVRMHENDHLNGVLFLDRMETNQRKKLEPLLKQIEKKYN